MIRYAALAYAAIVVLSGCAAARDADDVSPATPNVALATARLGSLVERIDAQGHAGPPTSATANLAFPEAGTLRAIDVRVGETVRAGQAVAELDRAPLAAPLAQALGDARAADASFAGGAIARAQQRGAQAKLAAARERLDVLERGGPSASNGRAESSLAANAAALKVRGDELAFARATELFAGGVIARKERDAAGQQLDADRAELATARARASAAGSDYANALTQARSDLASARADLQAATAQTGVLQGNAESARARVEAARVAYENGVLAAPTGGVVLAILKHPGETVDSTTPVVALGPQGAGDVTLTVSANEAARVAIGDVVTYLASDGVRASSTGRIRAIVPLVDRTTQVATILASGVPAGALEGASLSATIAVGSAHGIVVPASAIVEDPQSGTTVVFVYRAHPPAGESSFAMHAVRVRAADALQAVITGPVAAGSRVATEGSYVLLAPTGG